ncbi:hypothetical protein [Methylomicrobium sp. Wu6]|uniref:hypothetical protein n=1 Tax=Methylomicrobium sp. Wu6 TaxID=3107928 RepID=UPI002DD66373|nr:hypothetical protein [Methylomicrobium sp. Wu6]MEC4748191.1 hypothetical protein [Methylomicrobium sp. Wu6]
MDINRLSKKHDSGGIGGIINSIQTLFIAGLRVWTIPIVLMLSMATGFTTFYGLSHFIVSWIALIITIAIQSIIVISSLEIAGIHWKANRLRFFCVLVSLLVAVSASVTFSYFKFYEISQKDTIQIGRLNKIRSDVNTYLKSIADTKTRILKQQQEELDKASSNVTQAYFGTHPDAPQTQKNMVGQGPFFRYQREVFETKKKEAAQVVQSFEKLNQDIRVLQNSLTAWNIKAPDAENSYRQIVSSLQEVSLKFNQMATSSGVIAPEMPILMTYSEVVQGITPSFAMWKDFSLFAFLCASMADFFTVFLSYRLEFTAPGPLSEREQELVFECLRQFTEFRINENDELEMVIEKSEIEKARRYSDWSRMFAVGYLLSRGFLRKIDSKSVEFAPNLYPLIAERMSAQLRNLKSEQALLTSSPIPAEVSNDE